MSHDHEGQEPAWVGHIDEHGELVEGSDVLVLQPHQGEAIKGERRIEGWARYLCKCSECGHETTYRMEFDYPVESKGT